MLHNCQLTLAANRELLSPAPSPEPATAGAGLPSEVRSADSLPPARVCVTKLDWREPWPPESTTAAVPEASPRAAGGDSSETSAESARDSDATAADTRGVSAPSGSHQALGLQLNGASPFAWTPEGIRDACQARLLLAADVIYEENLTAALFGLLHQLMKRGPRKARTGQEWSLYRVELH